MVNSSEYNKSLILFDDKAEVTFSVGIQVEEKELYLKSASMATERLTAYTPAYEDEKDEHTIGMMTLFDMALKLKQFSQQL